MILIDAVPQENNAEALRESGGRWRIGESVKRFKPRQGHGAAGAAKDGAAGNATSGVLCRLGHLNHLSWVLCVGRFGRIRISFVQELRAGDDGLHQRIEAILFRRRAWLSMRSIEGFVGELERPVQSIGEQFAAEIIHEIVLAMLADVGLDAFESGALAAAGKDRVGIDRPSRQVFGPRLTHRSVAFKRQAERIETRMTGGADRVRAMLGQHVAERQIRLRFVRRQFGHHRRRRRNDFAEHAMNHPVSPLHRAGSQAGRVLSEEHRHRQQTAALVACRHRPREPRCPGSPFTSGMP